MAMENIIFTILRHIRGIGEKTNEPSSIAEVHERIISAVLRLCDMSREKIEEIIDDDIYDYGCG